jgi:hypothetical protein
MTTMTDEQLAEIRARCEAATGGPWEVGHKCEIYTRHYQVGPIGDFWEPADARFTAHAREDIPALLAEVERLRADAELGRLVREGLPAIAQHSGDEAWLRYDHLDQMWGAGYTGYAEFSSCDPDNALETVLGDVLRKA